MEKQLIMDSRWGYDSSFEDFEFFKEKVVPNIWFKESVPKDVKDAFDVIKKLIEHSYFVYEFYDEAASKALLTFEMALKILYRDLNGEKSWRGSLQDLIKWFSSKCYFEVLNDNFLDRVRGVRNINAHPERHSYGGPFMRQWIYHSMDLINDLYEDNELRKVRIDLTNKLRTDFVELNKKPLQLWMDNDVLPIYELQVVFIDNLGEQPIYYLAACPLFDYIDSKFYFWNTKVDFQIYYFATNRIDLIDGGLSFSNIYTDKPVVITESKEELGIRIENWKNGILTDIERHMFVLSFHGNISDSFSFLRREFHKSSETL